jgi:very-short-patch-repair endonuclease
MRGSRFFECDRARDLREKTPPAEKKLWSRLRDRRLGGQKFVRQQIIGPYFADFACREKRLIVEIDGATHSTGDEIAADLRREAILREQGYRIIRVTNDDVFNNLDGVCETILLALR